MGLIKGVFGKIDHLVIDGIGCLFINAVGNAAGHTFFRVSVDEVLPLFFHDGSFFL